MKRFLIICALLLIGRAGLAADADWLRLLPSEAVARQAVLESPLARQAQFKRNALEARAEVIRTGTAEFTLRTTLQNRRVPQTHDSFAEGSLVLERPVRAWGKASLDADVAQQTRTVAEIEQADALHEASRLLLQRWFDHWRSLADLQLARQHLALAEQLDQQTQARWRHAEVSKLEVALSQADLQRVRALHDGAQAQHVRSVAVLRNHYPALVLPTDEPDEMQLPRVQELTGNKADYLERNHELRLLRADLRRLALLAERASRDRWPDPTVGVFSAVERDGGERITGLIVSIPFSGSARTAQVRVAQSEVQAAEARLQVAEQQMAASFDALSASVAARMTSAQRLQESAEIQTGAALKAAKAYALGENSMVELIQIQRNAAEQRRDAARQRFDAVEQWATLQLDLHLLWDLLD